MSQKLLQLSVWGLNVRRDTLTSQRDFTNMMLLAEIFEEVLLNKKILLEDTVEIIQSIIIDLSRILYLLTFQEPDTEFRFPIPTQIS